MIVFIRSTKRAIRSSLLLSYSYLHIVYYQQGVSEKAIKVTSGTFLVLMCSTKGAMNSFFRRKPLYITYYQQKVSENAVLKLIFPSTDKIYQ